MNTNSDCKMENNNRAKAKYRVSLRYKSFIVEEAILTKTEKNAVIHFLYMLSKAMKRNDEQNGCPFYYKWEEI